MNHLTAISPKAFDGVFEKIGKEWMLIGASAEGAENIMTASWGCLGVLWNKPVAICFIRPQRHTYTLTEKAERLSLSFLCEEYREALKFCGRASGRDCDKFAGAGLTKEFFGDVPYPAEADCVLITKKLYADDLKKASFLDPDLLKNYPLDDFHRVYVCEIEKVLVKE